jgi:hypothetical protein
MGGMRTMEITGRIKKSGKRLMPFAGYGWFPSVKMRGDNQKMR